MRAEGVVLIMVRDEAGTCAVAMVEAMLVIRLLCYKVEPGSWRFDQLKLGHRGGGEAGRTKPAVGRVGGIGERVTKDSRGKKVNGEILLARQ